MSKTLLLADDSVTIQKVVGISFANEDVRLLTVDNGDDAIARVREAKPDVVLADVVMPGRNGYEVCEAIKSDPALRHIPVLLLTGTFEAFDAERARLAGADGFVTKPFEAQMLVDRVNELLARAAKAAPAPAPPVATPSEAGSGLDFAGGAPAGAAAEREPETQAMAVDDLDFSAGDDAFVFEGEDELATTAPPALHREEESAGRDLLEASPETPAAHVLGDDVFGELEAPRVAPAALPASGVFEFEEGEVPPEPGTLVEAPAPPEQAAETSILEAWSEAEEHGVFALESEAAPGPSGLDLELAGALAPEAPVPGSAGEAAPAQVLDSATASEFDVSSADLGGPLVPAEPPERALPPDSPAPAHAPVHAPAERRAELKAQLEKIAWEAFGDLTETLVRQTVARVEAIAWEVIPQLAESLIREEIRKLKEGD